MKVLIATVLCLISVQPGSHAFETIHIDGVSNCTEYPALLDNWVEVALDPGTRTFRLPASNYSPGPGLYATMVVIMLDQAEPLNGYWLFTLNGINDNKTVSLGAGVRAYFGFIDTDRSDNSCGSTVDYGGEETVYVDGYENCAEIPDLTQNWVPVEQDMGWDACYLEESSFGAFPGTSNPLALVYCVDSYTNGYGTLYSVHGRQTVRIGYHKQLYVGFLDVDASDNTGSSDVEFYWISPVEESNWGYVKSLY